MNERVHSPQAAMLSPWIEAWFAKYGAILFGVIVGTSAKHGLALAEGRKITTKIVIADALLLGMVALISSNVATRFGATQEMAALIAALFAVSSDRAIGLIRARFLLKVDAEAKAIADEKIGLARQIVQAEQSAVHIIEDTLTGKAPPEYEALKPHNPPVGG